MIFNIYNHLTTIMSEKILLSDFMSLIKRGVIYVLSQYKLIVKVTLITTCIGLAVGLLQKPKYKAVATFIIFLKYIFYIN